MGKIDTRREVEISLDFPVQLPDRILDRVVMRRPVMRDMIECNIGTDMSMRDSVNLVARLCDLVPAELEDLDTCDFEKLQNQLLAFRGAD